jgi:hypothetical protein
MERRTIRRLRIHSVADQKIYTPTTNTVSDTKVTPLPDEITLSKVFHMYKIGASDRTSMINDNPKAT